VGVGCVGSVVMGMGIYRRQFWPALRRCRRGAVMPFVPTHCGTLPLHTKPPHKASGCKAKEPQPTRKQKPGQPPAESYFT